MLSSAADSPLSPAKIYLTPTLPPSPLPTYSLTLPLPHSLEECLNKATPPPQKKNQRVGNKPTYP